MNKRFVYCDLCKVNHCGTKAIMLFPEDKAVWFMATTKGLRLCETHKKFMELLDKNKEVTFYSLKKQSRRKKRH